RGGRRAAARVLGDRLRRNGCPNQRFRKRPLRNNPDRTARARMHDGGAVTDTAPRFWTTFVRASQIPKTMLPSESLEMVPAVRIHFAPPISLLRSGFSAATSEIGACVGFASSEGHRSGGTLMVDPQATIAGWKVIILLSCEQHRGRHPRTF